LGDASGRRMDGPLYIHHRIVVHPGRKSSLRLPSVGITSRMKQPSCMGPKLGAPG
jgi:hypothetical protein